MTRERIIEKKEFYQHKIAELLTTDITQKVEDALATERERLTKEFTDEINADATKCTHYLEILDELLENEDAIAEQPVQENTCEETCVNEIQVETLSKEV